ncbi:MAG: alpha-E domain-containing protein [Acidobacteria bacterium]|nr:alpha-E domain-containing protein [Acidobacteriota bacterium]
MLSRVADGFYWMSRYLERAEHQARVVDVYLSLTLDDPTDTVGLALLSSIGPQSEATTDEEQGEELQDRRAAEQPGRVAPEYLTAVTTSIVRARENARQIREQISSAMWEQLNSLYLTVGTAGISHTHDPGAFMRSTIDRSHLFHGVTEATLSHGEGWHYMELGRYMERAMTTASMLQDYFDEHGIHGSHGQVTASRADYGAGVGLLRACAALEAYCRHYTADIRPERLAEFLLLNPEFPRSTRFAADRIEESLRAIARGLGRQATGRPERFAGRLRAALNYGTVDEILEDNVVRYLEHLRKQCAQIHGALYQTYITYPIETAIAR